jgi:CheY-like chemotaxis protein
MTSMARVLIVEDERCLQEAIAALLIAEGYEVALAANGREALERLSDWKADLVLTDVMMPVMDGRQLLRELRSNGSFRDLPVILMTAAPDVARAGMPERVPLLRKPFVIEALTSEIRRALSERPH